MLDRSKLNTVEEYREVEPFVRALSERLTSTEVALITLVLLDKTVAEIALLCGVTEHSIHNTQSQIREKFGVDGRKPDFPQLVHAKMRDEHGMHWRTESKPNGKMNNRGEGKEVPRRTSGVSEEK